MTATLEKIDRLQAAPADVDVVDVRRDGDELVIELEVRLPLVEPEVHHIPGFHADVTGC
jgi:hypothetical protein